jgi:hypothetical protein
VETGFHSEPGKETLMSESHVDPRRRKILKIAVTGVAAVPLSSIVLRSHARGDELPRLSADEPTARALQCLHDAESYPGDKRKPGTLCSNRNLIQAAEGE